MKKKILTIVGTRPELVKLSPLIPELDNNFKQILVHTGQHYDFEMDKLFFKELELREPDYNLEIGSSEMMKQLRSIIDGLRDIIRKEKPALVIVLGDTNSTLGGAIAASREKTAVMHIEAGCRSFNIDMPEELNRIIVDNIADYLVTSDEVSQKNLADEGIRKDKIYNSGDLVIEASNKYRDIADRSDILDKLEVEKQQYVLVTIHRAENTNDVEKLKELLSAINDISEKIKIIFPVHPRTKKIIEKNNIEVSKNISLIKPIGYLDFLCLQKEALFIMSDSGGIQKEAASLNVPCLILRNETEWTSMVDAGKNILVGDAKENIKNTALKLLSNKEDIEKLRNAEVNLDTGVSEKIVKITEKILSS